MNDPTNPSAGQHPTDSPGRAHAPANALLPVERRAVSARVTPGRTDSAGADGEQPVSGGWLSWYLHALRRRWPLAISLGLLCAALAASAAWVASVPTYTAVSLINVSADEQSLVFRMDDPRTNFEIYKGTQVQLLTSDFVLNAALRKVHGLEILKREEDPVRWLARSLRVESTDNSEILRVSLTTEDKNDAVELVQAVVDAYKAEVVDVERTRRSKRLGDLDHIYTEKETELRSKRTELKNLAEQLGSGDTSALAIKQQISLQQFAEARNELTRLRVELQRARHAVTAKQAELKSKANATYTPRELDVYANEDPVFVKLQADMVALDRELAEGQAAATENGVLAKMEKENYDRSHKAIENQLASRRLQLAERLKTAKLADRDSLDVQILETQSQVALLTEQEQEAAKDLDAQKKQTEVFGNSSIDVEMMRAEIQELDKVLSTIAEERQRLQVELGSQVRIKVIQAASPPAAPDTSARLQDMVLAGTLGFVVPVGLLLWWDVRARRVNSLTDVSRGLGLTVIGTVPQMSKRPPSRALTVSGRQRKMQIRLDYSIDGIAARLFLRRSSKNSRVVLVSSATRGEGKTTLATQLATRLARTGSNTLLVDFDLRRPMLHQIYGLPRGPGLSEFLQGEKELDQIVRQTDTPNLSIVTAGRPFADSLGALSNGVTGALFEKVRKEYEFVVVDGSPILPVVDALLASQYADTVVLSVRRDVSQTPKVQAACEHLAAFGVDKFVAVLTTGSNDEFHDYEEHEEVEEVRAEEVAAAEAD